MKDNDCSLQSSKDPPLSAYYPVSPDQWSVQSDALGGERENTKHSPSSESLSRRLGHAHLLP